MPLAAALTGLRWEYVDGEHGAAAAAGAASASALVWCPFPASGSRVLSQALAHMATLGSHSHEATVTTDQSGRQMCVDLSRFQARVAGDNGKAAPLSYDVRCRVAAGDSVQLLQDALGITCIGVEWQGWTTQTGWLPFDPIAADSLSKAVTKPGTGSTDEGFIVVYAPQQPMLQIKVKTFTLTWRNKDGR